MMVLFVGTEKEAGCSYLARLLADGIGNQAAIKVAGWECDIDSLISDDASKTIIIDASQATDDAKKSFAEQAALILLPMQCSHLQRSCIAIAQSRARRSRLRLETTRQRSFVLFPEPQSS